jgi:hypothetical protein
MIKYRLVYVTEKFKSAAFVLISDYYMSVTMKDLQTLLGEEKHYAVEDERNTVFRIITIYLLTYLLTYSMV